MHPTEPVYFEYPVFHLTDPAMEEDERKRCFYVEKGLAQLWDFWTYYWTGVQYYNYGTSEIEDEYTRYSVRGMASRNAVLGVYNCIGGAEILLSEMRKLPVLSQKINVALMRSCIEAMKKAFPDYISMRHAVAHEYELTSTMKRFELTCWGPNNLSVQSSFEGDNFLMSNRKRLIRLPINRDKAVGLKQMIQTFYRATNDPTVNVPRPG